MIPSIQLKQTSSVSLIAVALFAFLPKLQAVSPVPGGCYPAFTTAQGCNALAGLTTGQGNTGIGWYALFSAGAANFNTGIGGGALTLNTGDSNTAVGAAALLLNTSGTDNTAVGTDALVNNSTGLDNNAVGAFALFNDTGSDNEAMGVDALLSNTVGSSNIAIGTFSLGHTVSGSANTVVGATAGDNIVTGNNNTYIGVDVGGPTDESNTIRIGNADNSACFITGIVGTFNPTDTVKIDPSTGQLGDQPSSARFKKDIDRMDKASEAIFSLRPVTFHYKNDKTNTPQFGLIAEEVAKVNPALIGLDKEGKPYCVQYDKVNAMLLNEFLKEHQAFVEEQHKMEKLEATVTNLMATVKEQAAQIQKVSAQLELSKPAPQTVLNDQ